MIYLDFIFFTCAVFDSTVLTHASAWISTRGVRNQRTAETKQYGERWLATLVCFPLRRHCQDSPRPVGASATCTRCASTVLPCVSSCSPAQLTIGRVGESLPRAGTWQGATVGRREPWHHVLVLSVVATSDAGGACVDRRKLCIFSCAAASRRTFPVSVALSCSMACMTTAPPLPLQLGSHRAIVAAQGLHLCLRPSR